MALVQKVYVLPQCVYCYYIGRDGQSVARDSTIRNFWMYIKVLDSMCNAYLHVVSDEVHKQYLQKCIFRLGSLLYGNVVSVMPIGFALKEFDDIQKVLSSIPELTDEFMSITLSKVFKWKYVKYLIEHRKSRLLYLIMLKIYLKVARCF